MLRGGKSSTGGAVKPRGPQAQEKRIPFIRRAGPLLSVSDFGETALLKPAPELPADIELQPSCVTVQLQSDDVYEQPPVQPIPLYKNIHVIQFFVLNLCCGHRRPGDILDVLTLTRRTRFTISRPMPTFPSCVLLLQRVPCMAPS